MWETGLIYNSQSEHWFGLEYWSGMGLSPCPAVTTHPATAPTICAALPESHSQPRVNNKHPCAFMRPRHTDATPSLLAWGHCHVTRALRLNVNGLARRTKIKQHHVACMCVCVQPPSHLQQWSPPRWLGAARQWSPVQWNFRLRDWTRSCRRRPLLQNQARSWPTPAGNRRTSSCLVPNHGGGVLTDGGNTDELLLLCGCTQRRCRFRNVTLQNILFTARKPAATAVSVTYGDVETSQIPGGKIPISLRAQASWWRLERLRLAVM